MEVRTFFCLSKKKMASIFVALFNIMNKLSEDIKKPRFPSALHFNVVGAGAGAHPAATRQRLGRPDSIVFSQKLELSVLMLAEQEKTGGP